MDIEKNISPLVENMFPAFYQEEGPNFIAFVKAYYEWLEQANNTLYQARSLLAYRDIDTTVDGFILHFKEKYLKNIQFDTATNKKLLIKNSFDIYRSKGTERSIDLFFKLVYGIDAEVYYPGDDIFRVSDGDWYIPHYIEVTATDRSIDYVNKQITGVTSGATAFVEKYIKRRIKNGVVSILYVSNIVGNFINGESLKTSQLYSDSPKVIGSLNKVEIITGGKLFKVGDVVSFSSTQGDAGLARVEAVSDKTGIVDFIFVDGGYGYTTNAQSIVSENVLTLSNVSSSNTNYFHIFENFVQPMANLTFDTAVGSFIAGDQIYNYNIGGSVIGTGVVLGVSQIPSNNTKGTVFVSVTSGSFPVNNVFYTTSNTKHANVTINANVSVTGTVMGLPGNATLVVSSPSGSIPPYSELYQSNSTTEFANGHLNLIQQSGGNIVLNVTNINGVFIPNTKINIRNSTTTANLDSVSLTLGVYNNTGTFQSNVYAYAPVSNTVASVGLISSGYGAGFKVGVLGEVETIFINTDLLNSNNYSWIAANTMVMANQAFMTLPINNYAYGFQKNPQGNSASILYSCLTFLKFDMGVIGSITNIDPGTNYNIDPYVLVYQPYIAAFNRHDYVMNISGATHNFAVGERIFQTAYTIQQCSLTVNTTTGFQVGEKIYQGLIGSETATGVISTLGAGSMVLNNPTGTFANTTISSYINASASATVSNNSLISSLFSAKGMVKSGSNSSTLFVKRLNFENTFIPGSLITGQTSGANATIVSVVEDLTTEPIGLNANISANVVTANGTVTSLQIIDSGYGYGNGSVIQYVSENKSVVGDAKAIISGYGTGSGYFRSSKGFLSDDKYLTDSDYYQEYSYDVISKLPFDKYSEMFMKVMHVAGTKAFGSVMVVEEDAVKLSVADSSITQA